MNWRAIGCLAALLGGFLVIGLVGMYVAFSGQSGCPAALQWDDRRYLVTGTPAPSPAFPSPGPAVDIGSTFLGLTTRTVYGPPGSVRSTAAADRPATIAMDCQNGAFQTYEWDGISVTPPPTSSGG
ncbi:MAG TPA: hypothetical protein VH987_02260 [Candidatus Limnocylindria bacterium]